MFRPGGVDPPTRTEPTRLCLVRGPAGAEGPWPGVVVEWRRSSRGWAALVIYVVTDGDATTVVQTVLDAAYLQPVRP